MSKSNNTITPLQQLIDDLLSPYTRPHTRAEAEALRLAIAATGQPVRFDWVSIRAGVGDVAACGGTGYNLHLHKKGN